jgi:hypothetical protein
LEDLRKMETHGKNSCEEILRKLHSLEDENEALNIENVKLKVASVYVCVCVCVCVCMHARAHLAAKLWSVG